MLVLHFSVLHPFTIPEATVLLEALEAFEMVSVLVLTRSLVQFYPSGLKRPLPKYA